jgi:hypothetical protein
MYDTSDGHTAQAFYWYAHGSVHVHWQGAVSNVDSTVSFNGKTKATPVELSFPAGKNTSIRVLLPHAG